MMADQPNPLRSRRRILWRGIILLVLATAIGCLLAGAILFANDRLAPLATEAGLAGLLRAKLAEAQGVYTRLDDLWVRLEAGQALDCAAERVTNPYFLAWRSRDREAYPAHAALADALNGAIRELHRAADAWTAICRRAGASVTPDELAAARAALDRARAALTAVSGALP